MRSEWSVEEMWMDGWWVEQLAVWWCEGGGGVSILGCGGRGASKGGGWARAGCGLCVQLQCSRSRVVVSTSICSVFASRFGRLPSIDALYKWGLSDCDPTGLLACLLACCPALRRGMRVCAFFISLPGEMEQAILMDFYDLTASVACGATEPVHS